MSAGAFRHVRIDWRRKALAFRLFGVLPGGRSLYYLTQRYVTRTFPRDLSFHIDWAVEHARTFKEHYRGDLGSARLFEFGAGWDLFNNLVQWCYGVNRQLVVDIVRWARADQINHARAYLRAHPPPGCVRLPEAPVTEPIDRSLLEAYGIEYRAPADARRIPIGDGGVDLISTTSVLEHIPLPSLEAILRDCHRAASPGSISSHVIDYTDHYAHSDAAIGEHNFLRFTDDEWRRYNPDLHYQNRLRHFEYGRLVESAGFTVLAEDAIASADAAQGLDTVPRVGRFSMMTTAQLTPRTGHWVLGRR